MENLTLHEKIDKVLSLPNDDSKDTVVQTIEAIECFTDEERQSIFGSDNVVWVLKNYSTNELKRKVDSILNSKDVSVGDIVEYNHNVRGIVIDVVGLNKDRVNILYKWDNHYSITESVSIFDIDVVGNCGDIGSMLNKI